MTEDADKMTPGEIASHTFAYLRRIEDTQTKLMQIVVRHDERMGRIERDLMELKRDVHEVKSDTILIENQLLNRMNEILHISRRLDEQSRQGAS